jgi:hypothetical protein
MYNIRFWIRNPEVKKKKKKTFDVGDMLIFVSNQVASLQSKNDKTS